ncbi:hypothetical protein TSHO111613_13410 [Tsukamurella hominis]
MHRYDEADPDNFTLRWRYLHWGSVVGCPCVGRPESVALDAALDPAVGAAYVGGRRGDDHLLGPADQRRRRTQEHHRQRPPRMARMAAGVGHRRSSRGAALRTPDPAIRPHRRRPRLGTQPINTTEVSARGRGVAARGSTSPERARADACPRVPSTVTTYLHLLPCLVITTVPGPNETTEPRTVRGAAHLRATVPVAHRAAAPVLVLLERFPAADLAAAISPAGHQIGQVARAAGAVVDGVRADLTAHHPDVERGVGIGSRHDDPRKSGSPTRVRDCRGGEGYSGSRRPPADIVNIITE